jgi:hypothetical protein
VNWDRGHGAKRAGKSKPGGCATFGPLLEAYYHHALEPRVARMVAEHAAGCVACSAALERFAATDRLIADAPMPAPGPELRQRLAARIATARAQRPDRSPDFAPPMPIERTTVVHDVDDVNDVHDPNLARAALPTTHRGKRIQRMRVLLGTVAAALIVALLAGVLLARTPSRTNQVVTSHHVFSSARGACAPGDIKVHLPANSEIGPLAMVSPNEGWAVGSIVNSTNLAPVQALMLHYAHCAWTPVSISYPNAELSSVSMGSAYDGWAVGNVNGDTPLALHYTRGSWTRETLPGEIELDGHGIYSAVHMLSSTEGWIVINRAKDSHGLLSNGLLHFFNGHWSAVDAPFPVIEAVLPVATNEAWVAGSASNAQESPVLYHYQAGTWSKSTLPSGVLIDQLRMVSPNDIWTSGRMLPPNSLIDQKEAVLHYDGTAWTRVRLGPAEQAQIVEALSADEGWAFTLKSTQKQPCQPGADYVIDKVQFGGGAIWQTVPWQYKDLSGISNLERVAPDEYWAIGYYSKEKLTPTGNGGCSGVGYSVPVLLYFASGMWHQYGG